MYKKPVPIVSKSSKKSKKEDKTRMTDEKPSSTVKKSKADAKEPDKTPKETPKSSPKSEKSKGTPKESTKQPPPPSMTNETADQPSKILEQEIVNEESVTPSAMPSRQPLVSNSIVEARPVDGIQSAIKFRVSYGKESPGRLGGFKVPTTPNSCSKTVIVGCANCGKHSQSIDKLNDSVSTSSSAEMAMMSGNNREEFYKYLGIDTNPSQEKSPTNSSPTDSNALYNHRRSLRVFIQQRQNEFTRINEQMSKSPDEDGSKTTHTKLNGESIDQRRMAPENGELCNAELDEVSPQSNGTIRTSTLISSHIKQRHSYEPPTAMELNRLNNVSNGRNNAKSPNSFKETDIECDAPAVARQTDGGETSGTANLDKSRSRVQKRKVLLPSPMMLTEMFKRYRQCFKKGFAMRQQMRAQALKKTKKRPSNTSSPKGTSTHVQKPNINTQNGTNTDDTQPQMLTCEDLINTFSPTSVTHSNESLDSAIVVNSNINEMCPPNIILSSSGSLQWNQDLANHINKSQFRNPLDPKNGAVLAILTHTVSPNNADIVVVIQESRISYWYSTANILSMFGVARSWMRIGEITRINTGKKISMDFLDLISDPAIL